MIRPFEEFSLTLERIADLTSAKASEFPDVRITGVANVDADVEAGDLFLAFPGAKVHGADFAEEAIARGAVAVLTDAYGASKINGVPVLEVKDARMAGAVVAAALYRNPTRDLQSVAVTGTNGKTTVTTLLYEIFEKVGRSTGLIGTVNTRIGNEVLHSTRTTPEAAELQSTVAVMRERHMRHLVMEVSSHSLDMKRIVGSHFAVAAFTNLSQDHLDFHSNMESYFEAKRRLFTHEYTDTAVINIDTEYGSRLFESCEVTPISISRLNKDAIWHFKEFHNTTSGMDFALRGSGGILIESSTQLHGAFNLDNLMAAIAIAVELGVDPLEIALIAPKLKGAPGRMEGVNLGQPFKALVDYAHSPDAVVNVLLAAREFTEGKLIAVLGCGGDRDASKRPLMGQALVEGSDFAIMTSDNPRSEDPEVILQQMAANTSGKVILDRREAIAAAVKLATAGDTVMILGKGHETGQEIAGITHDFDDRLELARAIEAKK
jgi:UDP-N-acetylmuramoyl-L-alanyl-D-glutamate--2,6-diaminopimelate ligase